MTSFVLVIVGLVLILWSTGRVLDQAIDLAKSATAEVKRLRQEIGDLASMLDDTDQVRSALLEIIGTGS